jgi:hypothetical protein
MSWATMESAPRDGSRVLLYARSTLDPHHKVDLVVGRWDRDVSQWKVGTEYVDHAGELVPRRWMAIPFVPETS